LKLKRIPARIISRFDARRACARSVVCLTFHARTCPSRSIEAQGPHRYLAAAVNVTGEFTVRLSIYDFLIEQPSLTFLEENLTQQQRPRHDVATILLTVYIASRNEIFHYYVSYRLPCLPSWKFRESIILPARIICNTRLSRGIH